MGKGPVPRPRRGDQTVHSRAFAQLSSKLAEALNQQHKYDQMRPLYAEAVRIYKVHKNEAPADYVGALNQLGQFDLDQNRMDVARNELKEALDEAKKLTGKNKEILVLCMRSYESLLRQTACAAEADKLSAEAAAIEKTLKD